MEGVRPRVAGISPSSGSQDGGTAVTIAGATDAAGSGFSKFMQASFGSTYVGVTCNGNDCSADAPAGTGTVPVAIENLTSAGAPGPPDSQSFNFGYAVYPYGIMSPSTGPVGGGTGVVLSGHGLGLAPGATTITFGFTSGAVEVATSSCGPVSSPNGEISQQCSFTTPPLPNPPGSGTHGRPGLGHRRGSDQRGGRLHLRQRGAAGEGHLCAMPADGRDVRDPERADDLPVPAVFAQGELHLGGVGFEGCSFLKERTKELLFVEASLNPAGPSVGT